METLNELGVPIDARDWTEEDWQDLHEATEQAYAKIRERHKPKEPEES